MHAKEGNGLTFRSACFDNFTSYCLDHLRVVSTADLDRPRYISGIDWSSDLQLILFGLVSCIVVSGVEL